MYLATLLLAALLALQAASPEIAATPSPNPFADGSAVYAQKCMACHGDQGQGADGVPQLSGNDAVVGNPTPVIAIVKHGRHGMPAFGGQLTTDEIAAVVTYIRTAWGNEGTSVAPYQVDDVH